MALALSLAGIEGLVPISADPSPAPPGQFVGNEMEIKVDPKTGKEIRYLTKGNYQNGIFYPHARGWSADSRYLWFSSSRPRPDGTGHDGQMQLMAANTQNGNLYWLATLDGKGPFPTREIFNHGDYSPGTGVIVFFDMFEHDLYAYRVSDGKLSHLYHLESGRFGPPPSLTNDGRRLVFWASFKGPGPNEFFGGATAGVFVADLDQDGINLVAPPRMVTSYSTQIIPNVKATKGPPTESLSHGQINPLAPNLIAFCHGSYAPPDGTEATTRMWMVRADGTNQRPITPTPVGRYQTHELWAPDGKGMYYVDTGELRKVSVPGGQVEVIAKDLKPVALHLTVSADESRIAYDAWLPDQQPDANGDTLGEVWWYDVNAHRAERLARVPWADRYHSHAHPKISPDGSQIAFTVADGLNSRVAVVKVP